MQKTQKTQGFKSEGWMKVALVIEGAKYLFEAWTEITETETRFKVYISESKQFFAVRKDNIRKGVSSLSYQLI